MTPMQEQYNEIKKKYPETIVLFRLGDFFEAFDEDAKTISKVLGITLTGRGKGKNRVPMAGIPHHALENYMPKLVKARLKVAIADQVEEATPGKLVERKVTSVVTAGTLTDEKMLESGANNYIASVFTSPPASGSPSPGKTPSNSPLSGGELSEERGLFALVYADLSTGEMKGLQTNNARVLKAELNKIDPSELICPVSQFEHVKTIYDKRIERLDQENFDLDKSYETLTKQFETKNLKGFGIEDEELIIQAAGGLIEYLKDCQKTELKHIKSIKLYDHSNYMQLDPESIRNLELLYSMTGDDSTTVYSVLNECENPMGKRKLRNWLLHPLVNEEMLQERYDAVEFFFDNPIITSEVRAFLKQMADIERITGKIGVGKANPKDLKALQYSLVQIIEIAHALSGEELPVRLRYLVNVIVDNPHLSPLPDKGELEEVRKETRNEKGEMKIKKTLPHPPLIKRGGDSSNTSPSTSGSLSLISEDGEVNENSSPLRRGKAADTPLLSGEGGSDSSEPGEVKSISGLDLENNYQTLIAIINFLENSIKEEPSAMINEGGIIAEGYNDEIDELRDIRKNSKKILAEIQKRESEKHNIPSLKVSFNKVFGYYIEVTNTHKDKVPETYIRKQTLANAERYITEELKEIENKILSAEERLDQLEMELFIDIRDQIAEHAQTLLEVADVLAELDVLSNFGYVSREYRYTKPEIQKLKDSKVQRREKGHLPSDSEVEVKEEMMNEKREKGIEKQHPPAPSCKEGGKSVGFSSSEKGEKSVDLPSFKRGLRGVLMIQKGRHPVVEQIEKNFVSNDTNFNEKSIIHILTGPNMSGKSTYIRQVALITLIAQIGCFVPAESFEFSLVDRIFTRVGASDNLARGESTFMVEMIETANILNNATENSLVILDEVGRGTSTYDGVAIAWSVIEFIYEKLKCKTLFATHYHELVELEKKYDGIRNFNVEVIEDKGEILFKHKIGEGGTNKSYGVHVAKIAGIPKNVVQRANEILEQFESDGALVEPKQSKDNGQRTRKKKENKNKKSTPSKPRKIHPEQIGLI